MSDFGLKMVFVDLLVFENRYISKTVVIIGYLL